MNSFDSDREEQLETNRRHGQELMFGDVISFDYPREKLRGWQRWTVCVTDAGAEFVSARCLETLDDHRFLVDMMEKPRQLSWLTMGLFDPVDDTAEPLKTFGIYAPTTDDLKFMEDVISEFYSMSDSYLGLGIFPLQEAAS